jgi:hypothetical protein
MDISDGVITGPRRKARDPVIYHSQKGWMRGSSPRMTISYRVRGAPNDVTFKGDGRIWYANAPSQQVSQDNERLACSS